MTISPLAIKEYLSKARDDFLWLKTRTAAEIKAELNAVRPAPDTSGLMKHQLIGLFLGIAYPAFSFWYGMGIGKTLMTLRLAEYWFDLGQLRKAVVLVPSNEAVYTWGDEIRKWKIMLPFVELDDSSSYDKAERMLTLDTGLVIVSYPGLTRMVTTKEPEVKKKKETGKNVLKPQRQALDILCAGLDAMILDESTEVANTESLAYRIALAISKRVPIRYALAGRPYGRDPFDLWPQQFLIDHGESLGTTQGIFREGFFEKKKSYFGGPYSFDFKFDKTKTAQLAQFSGHRSMSYADDECADLPSKTQIVRRIPFPKETLVYYDKVVEHLIASRGDQQVVHNDFIRMRQLSSGFLGVVSDEFGAKVEIEFKHNPKLDVLLELLKQVPLGRKSVVFFEFIHSGKTLSAALKKAKIKHSWIWSGAKNRKEQMDRFRDDPECEVLLLNHQIGAYSLNLQHANYVFVYESPVGVVDRAQMDKRCWRTGQTLHVTITDLVMIDSVDERILDFHKEGNDLFSSMRRSPTLFRREKGTLL